MNLGVRLNTCQKILMGFDSVKSCGAKKTFPTLFLIQSYNS